MDSVAKLEPPDDVIDDLNSLLSAANSPTKSLPGDNVLHEKVSELKILSTRTCAQSPCRENDFGSHDGWDLFPWSKDWLNPNEVGNNDLLSGKGHAEDAPSKSDHDSKNNLSKCGFICQFCHQCSSSLRLLIKHISKHHPIILPGQIVQGYQEVICGICEIKFALCTYCGKDFVSERSIKMHIRKHERQKLFVCVSCCLTLPTENSELHILSHDSIPALCRSCLKTYKESLPSKSSKPSDDGREAVLEKRMLVVALERIQFNCSCGDSQSRNHRGSSTSMEAENRWCGKCANLFASSALLNRHLKELHKESDSEVNSDSGIEVSEPNDFQLIGDNGSEVVCEICDKTFDESEMLKEHMEIHMEYTKQRSSFDSSSDLGTLQERDLIRLKVAHYSSLGVMDTEIPVKVKDELFDPNFGTDNVCDNSDHSETSQKETVGASVKSSGDQLVVSDGSSHDQSLCEQDDDIYVEFCDDISAVQTKFTLRSRSIFNCEICGEVAADSEKLSDHMKIHFMDKNESDEEDLVSLTDEVVELTTQKLCCEVCGEKYDDSTAVLKHMEEHFMEENDDVIKSDEPILLTEEGDDRVQDHYCCTICDAEFIKQEVFMNHMKAHVEEKPFTCGFCEMGFTTASELDQHAELHHDDSDKSEVLAIEYLYLCKLCKSQFSTEDEFTKHLDFECEEKPFRCEVCKMRFLKKEGALNHASFHSTNAVTTQEDSTQHLLSSPLSNKMSEQYSTLVESPDNAEWELLLDPEENQGRNLSVTAKKKVAFAKKFKCKECNRCFAHEGRFENHVRKGQCSKAPSTNPKFICEDCGKTFSYEARYRKHVTGGQCVKSPSSPKYACNKCGKTFANEACLSKHVRASQCSKSPTDPKFGCGKCGKTYVNKAHFNKHVKSRRCSKSLSKDPKFACESCGKTFAYKSNFLRHVKADQCCKSTSTCSKFSCRKCGKTFEHKAHFDKHVSDNQCSKSHSINPKYDCEKCGRTFTYEARFNKHVAVVHGFKSTPTRPKFECKNCGKNFPYKANLQKHVTDIHGSKSTPVQSKFECKKCGKKCKYRTWYQRHLEVHKV